MNTHALQNCLDQIKANNGLIGVVFAIARHLHRLASEPALEFLHDLSLASSSPSIRYLAYNEYTSLKNEPNEGPAKLKFDLLLDSAVRGTLTQPPNVLGIDLNVPENEILLTYDVAAEFSQDEVSPRAIALLKSLANRHPLLAHLIFTNCPSISSLEDSTFAEAVASRVVSEAPPFLYFMAEVPRHVLERIVPEVIELSELRRQVYSVLSEADRGVFKACESEFRKKRGASNPVYIACMKWAENHDDAALFKVLKKEIMPMKQHYLDFIKSEAIKSDFEKASVLTAPFIDVRHYVIKRLWHEIDFDSKCKLIEQLGENEAELKNILSLAKWLGGGDKVLMRLENGDSVLDMVNTVNDDILSWISKRSGDHAQRELDVARATLAIHNGGRYLDQITDVDLRNNTAKKVLAMLYSIGKDIDEVLARVGDEEGQWRMTLGIEGVAALLLSPQDLLNSCILRDDVKHAKEVMERYGLEWSWVPETIDGVDELHEAYGRSVPVDFLIMQMGMEALEDPSKVEYVGTECRGDSALAQRLRLLQRREAAVKTLDIEQLDDGYLRRFLIYAQGVPIDKTLDQIVKERLDCGVDVASIMSKWDSVSLDDLEYLKSFSVEAACVVAVLHGVVDFAVENSEGKLKTWVKAKRRTWDDYMKYCNGDKEALRLLREGDQQFYRYVVEKTRDLALADRCLDTGAPEDLLLEAIRADPTDWRLVQRLGDPAWLHSYELWDINACVSVFEACGDPRARDFRLYRDVIAADPSMWPTWQNLEEALRTNPESVVRHLVETRAFDLAERCDVDGMQDFINQGRIMDLCEAVYDDPQNAEEPLAQLNHLKYDATALKFYCTVGDSSLRNMTPVQMIEALLLNDSLDLVREAGTILDLDETQALLIKHAEDAICGDDPDLFKCKRLLDLVHSGRAAIDIVLKLLDREGRSRHWLISVVNQLLMYAKIKFSDDEAGAEGISMCDTLLGQVELMSEASISLQDLFNPIKVRRLRDRLVKDDMYELALRFATQCGVEAEPVWASWGLAAIKLSLFDVAREKFRYCLHHGSIDSIKRVDEIISALEAVPATSFESLRVEYSGLRQRTGSEEEDGGLSIDGYLRALDVPRARSLSEVQKELRLPDSCPWTPSLHSQRLKECFWYLGKYGLKSQLANFCARHGILSMVTDVMMKLSKEMFIENVLVPLLSHGTEGLQAFLTAVRRKDQTLKTVMPLLVESCKYLNNNGRYAWLRQLQLFMGDRTRAGMTCIKLFADTHDIAWIREAQDHFVFTMEGKYLSLVQLQLEVGGEFCLFASAKKRARIAEELLVRGKFDLGFRVLQFFRLTSVEIYAAAAMRLAEKKESHMVNELLRTIQGTVEEEEWDEVVGAAISMRGMVEKLKGRRARVKGLLSLNKCKLAYLEAVKGMGDESLVRLVQEVSMDIGEKGVMGLCERWIANIDVPNV